MIFDIGDWPLETLRSKSGTTWTFDVDGQLIVRADRNGNQQVYTRAAEGRVDRVSNGGGRYIQLSYDNNGHVTTARDHTGRTVTYTHSSEGDLAAITTPPVESFPQGITRGFTYDANHNVLAAIDGNGATYLTNTWDAEGRKVIGQSYAGATCTIDYDHAPDTTRYTDWRGYHTDYEYDDNGNLLRETKHSEGLRAGDPAQWTTTHEYDADFKRIKTVYPRGNWTKYTFDARGNLTEVRSKGINAHPADDPVDDRVRAWTFDPQFNRITSYTDPGGNVTTYQLDGAGNTIGVTRPEVPDTTYGYHSNGFGWLTRVTASDGVITRYEYFDDESADGARYGYLKAVIRDAGPGTNDFNARSELAYDDLGNVTDATSPIGRTTTFRYDALRKLVEVTAPQPFGFQSRFTYDGNLRPILVEQQADAASTVWQSASFTYDLRGLPTQIERQSGEAVVTIVYDDGGLPVRVTDPEGRASEASYDERGFLLQQTSALGHETGFAYDPNGNLERLFDANDNATAYAYDRFDRIRRTTYPDTSYEAWTWNPVGTLATMRTRAGATFSYAYDDLNRQTQKVTPEQTYAYTYDDRSRLMIASNQSGVVTMVYDDLGRQNSETDVHGRTLGYAHDLSGNRTEFTYPDGRTISYGYDELDRLQTIRDAANQPLAGFGYDALGRYASLTQVNGTSSAFDFDLRDNLKQIRHVLGGSPLEWDYTANLAGVRTAIDAPEGRYDYTYDATWRLTKAEEPGGRTVEYDLDPLGNRYEVRENGVATDYDTNDLNQYTSVGGQARTFDGNGNLASDGTRTLVHDSENRLRTVTVDLAGTPTTVRYDYDAFGRRIARRVNGAQLSRYTYDGWDVVHETLEDDTQTVTYLTGLWIDQPLQRTNPDGEVYTFHQDVLGSIVAVTNASGQLIERYTYDAYGSVSIRGPTGNLRTTSSFGNEHFFTARRWDPLTQLYQYRNRDYDPEAGRFLQPDPLSYVDGPNLYQYVRSSPTNLTDPFGTNPAVTWTVGQVGGRALAAIGTATIGAAVLAYDEHYGNQRARAALEAIAAAGERALQEALPSEGAPGTHDYPTDTPSGSDYPTDADDWTPPAGWTETVSGVATGGRNRQWRDPEGEMGRRWDREGREGGKERGPHWHDMGDSSGGANHITPNR